MSISCYNYCYWFFVTIIRPVYAPKDFLDILSQVQSPNMASGPLPLSTLLRTTTGPGGGHHHTTSSSGSHSSSGGANRSSGGGSSATQQGSMPRSSSSSGNLADIVQMASTMSGCVWTKIFWVMIICKAFLQSLFTLFYYPYHILFYYSLNIIFGNQY